MSARSIVEARIHGIGGAAPTDHGVCFAVYTILALRRRLGEAARGRRVSR